MGLADEYADSVVQENYSDDPDNIVNLDELVDPPARYRDVKAWLVQGYEAGYRAASREPRKQKS